MRHLTRATAAAIGVIVVVAGCGESESHRAHSVCLSATPKITTENTPENVLLNFAVAKDHWIDVHGRTHGIARDDFVTICTYTALEAAPGGYSPIYAIASSGGVLGQAEGSRLR